MLVLAVLAAVTAAVPRPAGLVAVLTSVADAFRLGPAAFFTASGHRVRREDLPGGRESWSSLVSHPVHALTLDAGAGVLLARDGEGPAMTFLDAADGRVLWRFAPGAERVVALAEGRVLFQSPGMLRLLDARTGKPVWTRATGLEPIGVDLNGAASERLVAVGDDGRVLWTRPPGNALLPVGDGLLFETVGPAAALLDARTGRPVHRAGDLGVPDACGCEITLPYVACPGPATVWRLVLP